MRIPFIPNRYKNQSVEYLAELTKRSIVVKKKGFQSDYCHDKLCEYNQLHICIKFLFLLCRKKTLRSREESQAIHVPVTQVHRSHAQVRELLFLQDIPYERLAAASIV